MPITLTLVCGEAGVGAVIPLSLLLISRLSKECPYPYHVWSGLGSGWWSRPPRLGKGETALHSVGCYQTEAHFSPIDSQLGEKPQHYCEQPQTRCPQPSPPLSLVALISGSEPYSDQIMMMSIWGGGG